MRFLRQNISFTNLDFIPSSSFVSAFVVPFSQLSIETFDQAFIPYLLLVDQFRLMVKLPLLTSERRVC